MDDYDYFIPYFSFYDMPRKKLLLMKVFINRTKFSDIVFDVNETDVTISTARHKKGRYCAKIHLPVRILKPSTETNFSNSYNNAKHCFELFLQKFQCDDKEIDLRNYSKISSIDVISKHLVWSYNDFQEGITFAHSITIIKEPFKINTNATDYSKNNKTVDYENEIVANFNDLVLESKECTQECEVGIYGFAKRYKDKLSAFKGNWMNSIELPTPEINDIKTRHLLRWENERKSFDVEHYLADYFLEKTDDLDETVPLVWHSIHYKPYWYKINRADEKKLSPKQMRILANLPFKKHNLTNLDRTEVLHSLFDIILAYAYDCRINRGKFNSESAWNINKLSSTLSWFMIYRNVGEVVTSFFRRSLTYPLLRHWFLSFKVFEDALEIFHLGRRQLLNCLVSIFELLETDDDRKILNELYIEDYLIWIQQVHPETIRNYASLIVSCKSIKKRDVFSILPEIEQEAIQILKEGDEYGYNLWRRNLNDLISLMNKDNDDTDLSTDSWDDSSSQLKE